MYNFKPMVLFDLDGTLLNSMEGIAESCNKALEENGFALHDLSEYPLMVGNGADMLLRRALPEQHRDDETVARLRASYDRIYIESCKRGGGSLYPGVAGLLCRLREHGVLCGVLSNKPNDQTDAVCSAAFARLLDGWRGQLPGQPLKPDPAGLRELERQLGGRCVAYVGDSEVDIETGRNAGIAAIGVSWGFRPRTVLEQAGCRLVADNVEQLERLLLDILAKGE